MATNYPTSLDSYTTKNSGDTIAESHVNNLQDAMVATQTKIGTGSSTPTNTKVLCGNGVGTSAWEAVNLADAVTGTLPIANGGTAGTTAAEARTGLELGTISTQAANSVSITGGSITGITDIAVADGGTGSSTAATARTALGLDMFVAGDWILSTVTTARTGWTNVGATYADKFIRLGATADLMGAGADSHTHTTDYLPSHTHTGPSHTHTGPSHTHTFSATSGTETTYAHMTEQVSSGWKPDLFVANLLAGGSTPDCDSGSATNFTHNHTVSGTSDTGGTGATGSGGTGNTGAATAGSSTSSSTSNVPVYIRVVVFQKD